MSKITIKNVSSASVIIAVPEIRFRRELMPGRTIPITKEEYEDLSFDPGFSTLVRAHYLKISGIEEDQIVEQLNTEVFDRETIGKMLDNLDITAFAKFIPTAMPAEKETVAQLAIEKGITNSAITALIKKYCGIDVVNAIHTKHLAEEK